MSRLLRPVREDEADAYRDLLHEAYRADLELGVRFGASDTSREDVLRHLRGNLAYALVEDEDPSAILATVSVRLPWGPNPGPLPLPHAGWLAADPRRPERGTGAEALRLLEEHVLAQELRAPALTLGTAHEHPWLGDYYRRAGYTPIGRRDLGLGHLTDYYLKPLHPTAYETWAAAHRAELEGLSS